MGNEMSIALPPLASRQRPKEHPAPAPPTRYSVKKINTIDSYPELKIGGLKIWRQTWSTVLAVARVTSAATVLAEDAGSLNLPAAIFPESLAKTSARGATTGTADAGVEDGDLHVSASAPATIDQPMTITGPVTTGGIGDIGNLDGGVTSHVSTGIGNIQQGVSATAISF